MMRKWANNRIQVLFSFRDSNISNITYFGLSFTLSVMPLSCTSMPPNATEVEKCVREVWSNCLGHSTLLLVFWGLLDGPLTSPCFSVGITILLICVAHQLHGRQALPSLQVTFWEVTDRHAVCILFCSNGMGNNLSGLSGAASRIPHYP